MPIHRPVFALGSGPSGVHHARRWAVEACSEGLTAKYRRSQSLRAMLAPDTLPTTLKLVPA